jgi:hypothetical protein
LPPKPKREDVDLSLRLLEIFCSEPIQQARKWWRQLPEGLSLKEFESEYPKGSEAYEHFITYAVFWETVGAIMRRGFINEELAFDTFLDAPPWKKAEKIFNDRRVRDKQPLEGQNFQWIAERAQSWLKAHEPSYVFRR